jgi:S-adenosylmethionine synthetase, N-terminal domain
MAAEDTFLFTSESVNEGHPDKLADQVSRSCMYPSGLPGRFAEENRNPSFGLYPISTRQERVVPCRCPMPSWMLAWSRTRTPRWAVAGSLPLLTKISDVDLVTSLVGVLPVERGPELCSPRWFGVPRSRRSLTLTLPDSGRRLHVFYGDPPFRSLTLISYCRSPARRPQRRAW